ncbi:glutamyl-tRNA synthetase [Calocera viscosa TUFC12733]|uniref:Glutamate--tRNA ligase, mitochondrial n=1 Tax=Calocera viscosa (strain TUFC12733) TaxID=1330018 RepID=A0A167Q317_CALVF|nr:glutamyl-tRNA synthetase [Calocera viscosa TUFC12733]
MPPLPRLRFAPSPTGSLHLGGLRTALFNHLLARKWGGKWLLRIEDTDQTRLVEGSVDEIRRGLEWAGLDYDEGPVVGGSHGPYYQAQRLDMYHSHAEDLLRKDRAYRCFCEPAQLAATRLRLQQSGSMAGYDRTCRKLEPDDVKHRLSLHQPHCIRLSTPDEPPPSFADLVFGNPSPHPVPVDPIIVKTDGFPTYHLANVVDDHSMEITHVLRGEEWLPSVPLHLTLYSAFGWEPPQFAHLPLLLNPDGSKMSKRTGVGAFVSEYMDKGWEPEAVLNWLATAGWGGKRDPHAPPDPDATPSYLTLKELIAKFDLSNFTNRRTVLSPNMLLYLNKEHMQEKLSDPVERRKMAERIMPAMKARFPDSPNVNVEYVEQVIVTLESRLGVLPDLPAAADYLFQEPDYNDPVAVKLRNSIPGEAYATSLEASLDALNQLNPANWKEASIKQALDPISAQVGGMRQLMGSLRYALLGGKPGVGIALSCELLGREAVLRRLRERIANVQGE